MKLTVSFSVPSWVLQRYARQHNAQREAGTAKFGALMPAEQRALLRAHVAVLLTEWAESWDELQAEGEAQRET